MKIKSYNYTAKIDICSFTIIQQQNKITQKMAKQLTTTRSRGENHPEDEKAILVACQMCCIPSNSKYKTRLVHKD
jgi:hypothetical protein